MGEKDLRTDGYETNYAKKFLKDIKVGEEYIHKEKNSRYLQNKWDGILLVFA